MQYEDLQKGDILVCRKTLSYKAIETPSDVQITVYDPDAPTAGVAGDAGEILGVIRNGQMHTYGTSQIYPRLIAYDSVEQMINNTVPNTLVGEKLKRALRDAWFGK